MKRGIFTAVFFCCLVTTAVAQQHFGKVTGSRGEPVGYATVVLLKEGMQAAAGITDTTGRFTLPVAGGLYRLVIQNIAYKTLERDMEVVAGEPDLGVFVLEESLVALDAVVVRASAITREADRFVLRVSDDIPSMMNKDAAEVLKLAPGVWVDRKGISINGMSGTKVFVNERELRYTGEELADYLRNLRSSDIARVEVVPQAGARFSADSKGGVIRIVLRKQLENGLNGNLSLQTAQGSRFAQYMPAATLNAHAGRWTFNAYGSGEIAPKSSSEVTEARNYPDGSDSYFRSTARLRGKPRSGMGRLGVVYEPDTRNSLGAGLEYWSGRKDTPAFSETLIRTDGLEINSCSDYRQREHERSYTGAFNFVHRFDTAGSALKIIFDYTDKKVTGNNRYETAYEAGAWSRDSLYRNRSLSHYRIYTAEAVFDRRLNRSMGLTAGVRYNRNDMSNHALYENRHGAAWVPLPDYSYALDYVEHIGAIYGTFSAKPGRIDLAAGLRGEYTRTWGKGEGQRSYFDLFPSVNLTYAFNPRRTFMLTGQYSRSIERPNFWYLNSNRIQNSDYSYIIGNPTLRPTYIDRVSVTAVYNYRYTLTFGANFHRDLIREVTKTDPADADVRYVIPENHYRENHYFAALSCPLRLTSWLDVNANLVGVRQDIRATADAGKKSHYLGFANLNTTFSLPARFFLEVSYSYTSRLYSANSGVDPRSLFDARIKRRFFGDRMNVTLGVDNIFNSRASYFSSPGSYAVRTEVSDAPASRFLRLGVQFNFKTGGSFRQRGVENGLGAEKKRIEKVTEMK